MDSEGVSEAPEDLNRAETKKQLERQLRDIALNGGKQTVHYVCAACGTRGSKDVDRIDADLQMKYLKILDDLDKRSTEEVSNESAEKVLSRVRELSDEELAAEIARLRV